MTDETERDMTTCIMPWHGLSTGKVEAEWICHDYGCEDSAFCSEHVSEMLIDIANCRQKMFAGLEPISKPAENYPSYDCPKCGRIVMVVLNPLEDEGQLGIEYDAKLESHNNIFHSED